MRENDTLGSIGVLACLALGALAMVPLACAGADSMSDYDSETQGVIEQTEQRRDALGAAVADRQAAAAVKVHVDGEEAMWIFACDTAQRLMRLEVRQDQDRNAVFGDWVELDTGCAGTPAVGKWGEFPAAETVFVYIDSTSSKVYEYVLDEDGNVDVMSNVSDVSGFGKVSGAPIYVGSNSTFTRRGIAVRKINSNQFYTLDYYSGSWHAHPVTYANGTQAIATGNVTAAYTEVTAYYVTAQVSATQHAVFKRTSFLNNFVAVNQKVTTDFPGALNVASLGSTCGNGCAVRRGWDNELYYAKIEDSSWNWQVHATLFGDFVGTPYPRLSDAYDLYGKGSNGGLMFVSTDPALSVEWTGASPSSAPVTVFGRIERGEAFRQDAIYKGPGGRLHLFHLEGDPPLQQIDLGLSPRSP